MEDTHSGLVNYLFGKDRKREINRKTMHELQQKLMDDVQQSDIESCFLPAYKNRILGT